MKIETFAMERMQSTWENIIDYDMSESGVRPLTLRELVKMGFDLESFLDVPLGYSQSNGTMELRERLAVLYPGATVDHIEVTNGTSEANYLIALRSERVTGLR
jgi:aspartate/methionine/tyrosine aminotransferase